MRTSESIVELLTALIQARPKFGPVRRENIAHVSDTRAYTYANLATILEAVFELLVQKAGPLSGRAIKGALNDSGHVRASIEEALRRGADTDVLRVHMGPQNARLYAAGVWSVPSVPPVSRGSSGHSKECPVPYIGTGHSHTPQTIASVRTGSRDSEEL